MPSSQSIRHENAAITYAAVISNFRQAYSKLYNDKAVSLTDQEILFSWEEGWAASTGEEEDKITLEVMREKALEKLANE